MDHFLTNLKKMNERTHPHLCVISIDQSSPCVYFNLVFTNFHFIGVYMITDMYSIGKLHALTCVFLLSHNSLHCGDQYFQRGSVIDKRRGKVFTQGRILYILYMFQS